MTSRPLLSRLGWPRPATPLHGHEVVPVALPGDGQLQLARWLHPEARRAPATIEAGRVAALRARLAPGDVAVVIDGGGGAEALELGLAVGPDGAVVVLEADRERFPVLAANAALNRDRLQLFPHLVAVARPDVRPPPLGVPALPLEPFLSARHPGLIDRIRWVSFRFDAHGASLFEALRPLLAARRPMVRVQVEPTARRAQRQALITSLGESGYRLERFAWDGAAEPEAVTAANAMRWKRLDLLAVK